MRIKPGFDIQDVCEKHIIIAYGVDNIDFTDMITANESAVDVWNAIIGKDFTIDDMIEVLTSQYDIDRQTAKADCLELINDMRESGILED